MLRSAMALAAICLFANAATAQLFPNAPWNTRFGNKSDACPGGVCPNSPLRSTATAGHWTYPGTITNHLEGAHGVPTNGMTREQKLELHDALHEGRSPTLNQSLPTTAPASYAVSSYAPPLVVVKTNGSSGGGSTGGFSVGSRDSDGYVITSIGSVISPAIAAPATQPIVQGITPLAIGDRIAFRRSLLEAARNARKSGDITAAQFFILSAASRNPNVLDKMQQAVHEAAIEEGLATAQAIDWSSLISFIEKLIPIIIQLIDLFS